MDGHKEILFKNGVRREIFSDGRSVLHCANFDIKHKFPSGKIVWFFAETLIKKTIYPDGHKIVEHPNG